MRDFIGEIAKSLNFSMDNLKSAVLNGHINPRDADLVRRRIERLSQPQPKPAQGGTVVEQGLQQLMAQGQPQRPSMAMQMTAPEEITMAQGGVAELPVNMFDEANYAGGGIIAFADGDLVEGDDEYKGIDYDKMYEKYIGKGLPKSPVSKYFQYDVPRPETGYLKRRMEKIKGEGLDTLDVKKLTDKEREAYGIKDIYAPRIKEIEGFKEQAEKARETNKGLAGLQAAAALLSEPTMARGVGEAFKVSGATLSAGEREYIKDVRDASKLAFEAGAAQQAYNADLYRGDTARAKENRARYEGATDKLAAFDENFIKGISDRLGTSAESAAAYQAKVDAAKADNAGKNMFGTLNSTINNGIVAIANQEGKINSMFPADTLKTVNMNLSKYGVKDSEGNIKPKPGLTKDQMEIFTQSYATYDNYTKERSMLESMRKSHAKLTSLVAAQAGVPEGMLDIYGTNTSSKQMAQPSKNTIQGEVDYSNPLLKPKS